MNHTPLPLRRLGLTTNRVRLLASVFSQPPKPKPVRTPLANFDPQPGEPVPLKLWLQWEAKRVGIKPKTLYGRIERGKYPCPPVIRSARNRILAVIPVPAAPAAPA